MHQTGQASTSVELDRSGYNRSRYLDGIGNIRLIVVQGGASAPSLDLIFLLVNVEEVIFTVDGNSITKKILVS